MTVQTTIAALQRVLAAEHAAIYGYGVAGARLAGERRQIALRWWDAHRTRRDRLRAMIESLDGRPVAAAPAYRLPFAVDSARSAAKLAAALEDGVTAAYLGLAGVDSAKLRRYAALSMQEAAARAVRWRGSPTSAFPGMTASAVEPRPTAGAG